MKRRDRPRSKDRGRSRSRGSGRELVRPTPVVVLVRRRARPDFTAVLPLLTDERRDWLAGAISLTYGTRHRPARATAG
ncbi:hypothetical protein ACIQRJ_29380 [Streptomyces niveus]|uniref:hypothetical protein n=1 Tax=Streptomyces niveus TaxID=193462 RepID=UPI003834C28C